MQVSSSDLTAQRAFLSLEDITWSYDDDSPLTVFEDFHWEVERPGLVLVHGPNMSGKTTLFKLIAGELKPVHGVVSVVPPIEYLPQNYEESLFPWKDAAWNVALPELVKNGHGKPLDIVKDKLRGLALLDAFEAEGVWNNRPATLSGGIRHLLTLGRAFASEAPTVLLDEPFTGLDKEKIEIVSETFGQFLALHPSALVVIATHQRPKGLRPGSEFSFPSRKPVSSLITLPPGRSQQ